MKSWTRHIACIGEKRDSRKFPAKKILRRLEKPRSRREDNIKEQGRKRRIYIEKRHE
jgi:hypothetical protein